MADFPLLRQIGSLFHKYLKYITEQARKYIRWFDGLSSLLVNKKVFSKGQSLQVAINNKLYVLLKLGWWKC